MLYFSFTKENILFSYSVLLKLFMVYREFRDRMRAFAQFYTAQEYEQFLTNLERERELRLRLTELYRYREHGITRHEECAHFEQVMAQTQGQNDAADHWNEKKSVSIHFHLPTSLFLIAMAIGIFFLRHHTFYMALLY